MDTSASKLKETVILHLVESTTDIKAAVANLVGQTGHQNVKGLGASGIETTMNEKAGDAHGQRLRITMPQLLLQLLALCGKDVEEIETEDKELLAEPHHL